jgi:uncharacterized membrane protein YidH (DUF202 family)
MSQLWTIIFVAVLAVAFGIAAWHDREEEKRRRRRDANPEERGDPER